MAAIDFPASPTVGQAFAAGNGVVYTWSGTLWLASGASAGGDFMAMHSVTFAVPTTPGTAQFDTVYTGNSGGWYNTSTGRYTPPAGRYKIFCTLTFSQTTAISNYAFISLRRNGVVLGNNYATMDNNGWHGSASVEGIFDASGSDYFDIVLGAGAAGCNVNSGTVMFGAFPISGIKGPPGDAGAGSYLRQVVTTQTGAVATGTTIVPYDDTIPQITEGTEFMTLSITPTNAASRLIIEVTWIGACSVDAFTAVALFRDAVANALAVGHSVTYTDGPVTVSFKYVMVSGGTSPITFRVRAGCNLAGTITFNGQVSARRYGGVMASSIAIQEVGP